MVDTVKATTITLAEQGDIGLDAWALFSLGVLIVGFILIFVGIFINKGGLLALGLIAVVSGFIALFALSNTYENRMITDLQNRQEAALDEQLGFSDVRVSEDGDFAAADSDGQHVSGLFVEKDDTVYYVIIDDKN